MARFNALLQSLARPPAFQQGLFDAARGIGATPVMLGAQRRAEEERQRINAAIDASTTGITAAQEGDTQVLLAQIDVIKEQIAGAGSTDERLDLVRELRALQALIPGAKTTETNNTAKSIIETRKILGQMDERDARRATGELVPFDERSRGALEQRLKVMSDNPEALEIADKFRLEQARIKSETKTLEGQNWLNANTAKMLRFIENNDADGLESFVAGAGEFSGPARKFVQSALAGQESLDRFRDNSIAMKIAPAFAKGKGGSIVSAERSDIETLPEAVQDIFGPALDKYEKLIEDGWDDKNGTWREGYRTLASNAQKDVQGLLNNVRNQIATSEYFAELNRERDTAEQIEALELLKESPVSTSEARILADSLIPRDKKNRRTEPLTVEKINEAKDIIRQSRNAAIDAQIQLVRGPQTEEEQETGAGSTIEGPDGEELRASDHPGKKAVDEKGTVLQSDGKNWLPVLEEATVSARKRSLTPPQKPITASDIYGDSVISEAFSAMGRGIDAAGRAISDKAERQRQRIQQNPYGGAS